MKHKKRKLIATVTAVFMLMTVCIVPAEFVSADSSSTDVKWTEGITGGAIYFDESTGTITKCDTKVTEVIIPEEINGVTVTDIGEKAFSNCYSLTSITIPDSVTTIGGMAFYSCNNLTSVTIPDSVTIIGDQALTYCDSLANIIVRGNNENYSSKDGVLYNKAQTVLIQYPVGNPSEFFVIPDGVKNIGCAAFWECESLTSVTIPDGVTTIENAAFYSCKSLTSVTIPNSVITIDDNAFGYCEKLKNITIPDDVTTIGDCAFYACESLTSVTIPDNVTNIGNIAFYGCDSLTNITVEDNNENYSSKDGVLYDKKQTVLIQYPIGNSSKSFTIPDSVTTIGESAFEHCETVTSVIISDSVTSIGRYAFASCDSLTSVTMPDSVTAIGDEAFYYCDSLTSIIIPDSVTTIGENAFTYCKKLTSITIPDSVTAIGDETFYGCDSLTNITVGENNENYSSKDGVLYDKAQTVLIQYPIGNSRETFTIPNSVTTISDRAFNSCKKLTSVTIPDNVTTIGEGAFGGCKSLISIIIPDSVTTIGEYVFWRCDLLTVYGYEGSYAEEYAKNNDISFKAIISDAPGKVTVNLYKDYDDLKVSWNKVAGADGYYVYYKKSTWSSYKKLGSTTKLTYTKVDLTDGAKYKFRVYPYMNIDGQKYRIKSYKSSGYVYTLKKLNKPSVKKSSCSYVKVSWNNIKGESGYEIARSKYSNKKFALVKRVSYKYKSATIKTPRYKKYYYKVRAYKTVNGKKIYGPWSSVKSYKLK